MVVLIIIVTICTMSLFGEDEISDVSNSRYLQIFNRPKSSGVPKFHEGTEEALLLAVDSNAKRNDPQSVLDAIDDFCYSRHWMMHIGDVKGVDLDRGVHLAIQASTRIGTPVVLLELGSYCGYSAVRMARHLVGINGIVISIDSSPKSVSWTNRMVEISGLSDKVHVVLGTASSTMDAVKALIVDLYRKSGSTVDTPGLDLLLIDHEKSLYYSDLIVYEKSGLLRSGSVVVTDNVLSFGNPKQDLIDHVRDSRYYESSVLYTSALEYSAKSILFAYNNKYYHNNHIGELSEKDIQSLIQMDRDDASNYDMEDGVEISVYK